jgi:gamma-glutamyltranspeptidase/glutathione hydrolase
MIVWVRQEFFVTQSYSSARAFRVAPTDANTFFPRLMGTRGAVAGNSYLSVNAGVDMLKAGGNAIDAACAATLVEGLVNPQMNGIGGECPILIRPAGGNGVIAINGNMAAPMRATPEAFTRRGLSDVPDEGILSSGVPATLGAIVMALSGYGTLSFAEIAAPVIALATEGFAVSSALANQLNFGLSTLVTKFAEWPGSRDLYTPGGVAPAAGDRQKNAALADMYSYLANTEQSHAGGRAEKLQAVRDAFYRGDIATEIARFSTEREGLLARSDLEQYETWLEQPVSIEFGDTTVFKCGFWTQGPVMLQTLAILAAYDLHLMGHNSTEYCHVLIEAMKLAFADREQYYGDPAQTSVPAEVLLSSDYARRRAALIDPRNASQELRPGDAFANEILLAPEQHMNLRPWGPGTVHVDAIDPQGNMASFTPSGGWLRSGEVIAALGFPLSCRMMTFYLGPENHPNIVAPGKRPRTTLTPSLAFKNGRPWMTFGTMGGDQQDQWLIQFFLNRAVFGMTIQEAIEAPKLSSEHFPGFFAPHQGFRNRVRVEARVGQSALDGLRSLGHEVDAAADWTEGFVSAAQIDEGTGMLEAGCDPRGSKSDTFPAYAFAW